MQQRSERRTVQAGPAGARGSCGRSTQATGARISARGARAAPRAQPRINPVLNSSARSRSMDRNPVVVFLRQIGLPQYADPLLHDGFDDMETLQDIEEEHMKNIGMLPGHMLKLKKRLKELHPDAKEELRPAVLTSTAPVLPGKQMHVGEELRPAVLTSTAPVLPGKQMHVGGPLVPCGQMINAVQQSWLVVKELGVATVGEIFYKHLFKIAPQTKKLFPLSVRQRYYDWRCGEIEDENNFENSPALRNLFSKVVGAVGSAVAGLQNINKLVPELHALGMRHINYNMQEEYFGYGGQALVLTLRDGLGEMLTADIEQAWVSVYDFLSATIICGLRTAKATEAKFKSEAMPLQKEPKIQEVPCMRSQEVSPEDELKHRLSEVPAPPRKSSAARSRAKGPMVPSGQTINAVQQSWLVVKELGTATVGEILYKHLFKIAPQTKKLFPLSVRRRYQDWASGVEEDEHNLENSPALRNLFSKVVGAVGSAVAGLQNINKLVPELNALGMRHINYNMQEEYFEYGGQALVLTLRDGLGDMLTQEVEQAWISVYEFISASIISGLRFATERKSLLMSIQDAGHQPSSPSSTASHLSGFSSSSFLRMQSVNTETSVDDSQEEGKEDRRFCR